MIDIEPEDEITRLRAENARLKAELDGWKKSFVGHVYVKNEEYDDLCKAAKDPNFITNLKATQVAAIRQATELQKRLDAIIGIAQGG